MNNDDYDDDDSDDDVNYDDSDDDDDNFIMLNILCLNPSIRIFIHQVITHVEYNSSRLSIYIDQARWQLTLHNLDQPPLEIVVY